MHCSGDNVGYWLEHKLDRLFSLDDNSTGCPYEITVEVIENKKQIIGVAIRILRSLEKVNFVRRNFVFLQDRPPIRNRSRFACPSEVTCWWEIFYPFSYLSHMVFSLQAAVVISIVFLSISLKN